MAEWLKAHAWKAKRASDSDPPRSLSRHTRSATYPSNSIPRCASVDLDVSRGFEPHVSQPYHNREPHLAPDHESATGDTSWCACRRVRAAAIGGRVQPGQVRAREPRRRGWLSTRGSRTAGPRRSSRVSHALDLGPTGARRSPAVNLRWCQGNRTGLRRPSGQHPASTTRFRLRTQMPPLASRFVPRPADASGTPVWRPPEAARKGSLQAGSC
jgi:hypothetical protein